MVHHVLRATACHVRCSLRSISKPLSASCCAGLQELVAASLDAVGLHQVEHLYPSELSGGMQKRVALARAIIRDSDNPGPEQVLRPCMLLLSR